MQEKQKKYHSMRAGSQSGGKAVVQIGDIVVRRPVSFLAREKDTLALMRGKVVWIHPLGRYHTVEFGEGEQAIRESFMGIER